MANAPQMMIAVGVSLTVFFIAIIMGSAIGGELQTQATTETNISKVVANWSGLNGSGELGINLDHDRYQYNFWPKASDNWEIRDPVVIKTNISVEGTSSILGIEVFLNNHSLGNISNLSMQNITCNNCAQYMYKGLNNVSYLMNYSWVLGGINVTLNYAEKNTSSERYNLTTSAIEGGLQESSDWMPILIIAMVIAIVFSVIFSAIGVQRTQGY